MKINVEQTIKRRISEKISAEMDLKRTTWEILTLEALHNEFGFGMDRLKRFTDALQASYDEYTRQAELTDTYKSYKATNCFLSSCDELYNDALEHTGSPQIARSVLPTCLATRLYMTMTLERWRDFLKLRTSPAAHPDMRVIAEQIQRQLFPDEIGDSNAD